jgi:hypothetical protein
MRRLPLVAAAVVLFVGCGGRPSATKLTIAAVNPAVGRAVFHLECLPARGDLPDPPSACAALARAPQLVTNPKPFTCFGGSFSWWDVAISGRLNGRPLHRSFSTCWTTQMATLARFGMSWPVLRDHLLPRRSEAVVPGTTRTFAPGVLQPADRVTCDIRGHDLVLGVPVERSPGSPATTGYGGANVVPVTLAVSRNRDGSVTAACHDGSS